MAVVSQLLIVYLFFVTGGEDRGRDRILQRGVHPCHKGVPAAAGQQDGEAHAAADPVGAGDPPAHGATPSAALLLHAPGHGAWEIRPQGGVAPQQTRHPGQSLRVSDAAISPAGWELLTHNITWA